MVKRAAWCAMLLAALVSSCGGQDDGDVVLVMAASSLTDAFSQIEVAFEDAHPGIDVQLNLAGSASLREQILQGAPADVFASANNETMQAIVDAGEAQPPTSFASNELQIAVPRGNPGAVAGLADLANDDLLIGLCGEQVPCGQFARQALEQAGVVASVDTNEGDVRSLVTKLEAGELDAGIVYRTDVAASDELEGIDLPAGVEVGISYPITDLRTPATDSEAASLFVEFVLSAQGQDILQSNGFGAP